MADLDPRLHPLSKQNFDLAGIDFVVNTHLHFDHCGGNHTLRIRPTTSRQDFGGIGLWVAQTLLAVLFLFAGGVKLVASAEVMSQGPVVLSTAFVRFIGICEVLGAIGLILPGVFRIHRELTPLAAAGLVIIMIGATTLTAISGDLSGAIMPLAVGITAITIAWGR